MALSKPFLTLWVVMCASKTVSSFIFPHSEHLQEIVLPNGMKAICDQHTDGGHWILLQRRHSDTVDFARNWTDYASGFGDLSPTGNFWFGLQKVHQLCNTTHPCQLRVELTLRNKLYYAKYDSFTIASESDLFRIHVSGYHGTAGDALIAPGVVDAVINGMAFTTMDSDNDLKWSGNCADSKQNYGGGWWYHSCTLSTLNAKWDSADYNGVYWNPFSTRLVDLVTGDQVNLTEMKFRRQHR